MMVTQYQTEHSPGYGKYWTVYLPAAGTEENLPAELKQQLGGLFREDEFDLAADKFIAEEEKNAILSALEKDGYYVEEKQLGIGLVSENDDVDLII